MVPIYIISLRLMHLMVNLLSSSRIPNAIPSSHLILPDYGTST